MKEILNLIRSMFPSACHDRLFLTGGTVRDMLLGRKTRDLDLVAVMPHQELLSARFRPVHPTSAEPIYFRFHPVGGKVEVIRLDFFEDLDKDLRRRDFTINSMAMDLEGKVIDPVGGLTDLEKGVLRASSPASFSEDPLRIFRAFRFEAEGWRLDSETEAMIRGKDWTAPLAAIPQERFTSEMQKALSGTQPDRFFRRMVGMGVGEAFCPPPFRMPSVPAGPIEYHPEGDLFTHSLQVLQHVAEATGDNLARFCAFFHDIGKLATEEAHYPRHHGHEESGGAMAGDLCVGLRLPSAWKRALSWVSRLHGKANRWDELRDSTRIRMAQDAIRAGIAEILPLVAAGDKGAATSMAGWQHALRAAEMNCASLGIDEELLRELPPDKRTSLILQRKVEALRRLRR